MYVFNTFLQVIPRPGSSQVSSAAGSDVEMEGGIEQQHTLDKEQRKRPPEDAVREWKRQKDSDSAGQQSNPIDEIIDARRNRTGNASRKLPEGRTGHVLR